MAPTRHELEKEIARTRAGLETARSDLDGALLDGEEMSVRMFRDEVASAEAELERLERWRDAD